MLPAALRPPPGRCPPPPQPREAPCCSAPPPLQPVAAARRSGTISSRCLQHRRQLRVPAASGSSAGAPPTAAAAAEPDAEEQRRLARLLDEFWAACGVADERHRRRLVEAGQRLQADAGAQRAALAAPGAPAAAGGGGAAALPSVGALMWAAGGGDGVPPAALRATAQLLALRRLLGEGSAAVDAALPFMLVREPALLAAAPRAVAQRLLDLRLAGGGGDVVALVAAQPALLLEEGPPAGGGASSGGGSESGGDSGGDSGGADSDAGRRRAWAHGLLSDGDGEWAARADALAAYAARRGDAHAGFRPGDDPALARWARLQRAEAAAGALPAGRRRRLEALGFEFDAARAEWLRFFCDARGAAAAGGGGGGAAGAALHAGGDFETMNWVTVQRQARRAGALEAWKVDLLSEFLDWDGSDPLS